MNAATVMPHMHADSMLTYLQKQSIVHIKTQGLGQRTNDAKQLQQNLCTETTQLVD